MPGNLNTNSTVNSITGRLNDKTHLLNPVDNQHEEHSSEIPSALKRVMTNVLSTPGQIVSFTELNKRGLFKRNIEELTGKRLMEKVADEIDNLQIGKIERFTVAGNRHQVSHL